MEVKPLLSHEDVKISENNKSYRTRVRRLNLCGSMAGLKLFDGDLSIRIDADVAGDIQGRGDDFAGGKRRIV